ncbi:MAG: glycosyltransferase family 2 protein [Flavobacteriales bacterium]|nr:glycosyltransferase family 2 protein [Flavobacteriales bacterium]
MAEKPSWSVIVLCYNEESTIEYVIERITTLYKPLVSELEIIIVDDGSKDKSVELVKAAMKVHPEIKLIKHKKNKGIGRSLVDGYKNATKENVMNTPGDAQWDYTELIPHIHLKDKTILSFYRLENTSYSLFRNILSFVNKTLNQIFLGISMKDVNWVKAYRKDQLDRIDFEINSSLIETEICSKLLYLDNHLIEVKSKYLERKAGVSKGASIKIVWQAFRELFKLIFIIRGFRKRVSAGLYN